MGSRRVSTVAPRVARTPTRPSDAGSPRGGKSCGRCHAGPVLASSNELILNFCCCWEYSKHNLNSWEYARIGF